MRGNKIINLIDVPTDGGDAASKEYVDQTVHQDAAGLYNVFDYIMEDVNETSSESEVTVVGIEQNISFSPHRIYKKAYILDFAKRDNGDGTFSFYGKLGLQLYSLPLGDYTIIAEIFPRSRFVNSMGFTTNDSNKIKIVKNVNAQRFLGERVLCQFQKLSLVAPSFIFLELDYDAKPSITTDRKYAIFYGAEGLKSNIPPSVIDAPFATGSNGTIEITRDLQMDNRKITSVGDPASGKDAANKDYVDKNFKEVNSASVLQTNSLDVSGKKIVNLEDPTEDKKAATKKYLDLNLIHPSETLENVFDYLTDTSQTRAEENINILSFVNFSQSPHTRKEAFSVDIVKNPAYM